MASREVKIVLEYRYQDPRIGTWYPLSLAEDLKQYQNARYRIQARVVGKWEDLPNAKS